MVQDTAFGKMCLELSVPIAEMTLPMFLDLWSAGAFLSLQTDGRTAESQSVEMDEGSLNGVCLTLNTSEFPNVAVESSLSSILERGGVDSRFYLSKTACSGILRRAETRGKVLPKELKDALESCEHKTIGCLQARDYKGVGSQYVNEGKVVVDKTYAIRTAQTGANGIGVANDKSHTRWCEWASGMLRKPRQRLTCDPL